MTQPITLWPVAHGASWGPNYHLSNCFSVSNDHLPSKLWKGPST